jgi:hypothetical protein
MSDLKEKEDNYKAVMDLVNDLNTPDDIKEALTAPDEGLSASKEERIFSELEQEAVAKGWKPDGYKSAEWFLEDEAKYEEIKVRGKEIKALQKEVEYTKKHAYEQALSLIHI